MYVLKSSKYLNFPYCTNLQKPGFSYESIYIYIIYCVFVCVYTHVRVFWDVYMYIVLHNFLN